MVVVEELKFYDGNTLSGLTFSRSMTHALLFNRSCARVGERESGRYHDQIGGRTNGLVNALVRRGRARLSDVEESNLVKSDGTVGAIAERQRIQRKYTLLDKEYFGPELLDVILGVTYPLHFIDFETSRLAVPYHAGMRPYEQIAFQWSCHTILQKGAVPSHSQWINLRDAYPNFEFVETLKDQLGNAGTILIWSKHERAALRDIAEQMVRYGYRNQTLESWIDLSLREFERIEVQIIVRMCSSSCPS